MKPTVMTDGQTLAEGYESLRQETAEWPGGRHHSPGRALFLFKGMAAWMRCVGETAPSPAAATAPRNESRLPAGIEQNLINLVASMALATARERTP